MSTLNIFQISFEIWGCIISIIISAFIGTSLFKNDKAGKILWGMLLTNNFILVSDAIAYVYRGDVSSLGIVMDKIGNFGLFAFEYILLFELVIYVDLMIGKEHSPLWKYIPLILLAVAASGLVITQFTGFYYHFDSTNNYQRGDGLTINFVLCGIIVIICMIDMYVHRKVFSRAEITTFIICISVFIVCVIIQFIFYGLSLLNMGITIALIVIYLRHYKIQYDLYISSIMDEIIEDPKILSQKQE